MTLILDYAKINETVLLSKPRVAANDIGQSLNIDEEKVRNLLEFLCQT
jgi:hypothetical protein